MSTLSDSNLSDISNPLSLSVNPDQIMESDNSVLEAVDFSGISKFLFNTIKRGIVFDPVAHEDSNKIWETNAMGVPLFFVQWDNKESQIIIKNFLIDPIALKDTTAKVSAEGTIYNLSATPVGNTRTLYFPDGAVNSSNSSSTYTIRSGNTEMRDTYINQRRSPFNRTVGWLLKHADSDDTARIRTQSLKHTQCTGGEPCDINRSNLPLYC